MPARSHSSARAGEAVDQASTVRSDLEARYDILEPIGEGTYGVVYRGADKKSGRAVALKKIRLDNQELLEEIGVPSTAMREIVLLAELRHPNVVALVEVAHVHLQLWLIFEYCQKDLKHFLKGHVRKQKESYQAALASVSASKPPRAPLVIGLPISVCKKLTYQLLSGLAYCHGRRILHRDLKPQNLLLDGDENGQQVLKIADFGLARTFTAPSKPKTQEVVTLWYRAPELLLGDKCYGASVDLWSVGCIMGELVSGRAMFPGDSEIDTLFRIFRLLGPPTTSEWPGVANLSHFQEQFPKWVRDREKSLRELLSQLDDAGLDLILRMLAYVPGRRISAAEALNHPWLHDVVAAAGLEDESF